MTGVHNILTKVGSTFGSTAWTDVKTLNGQIRLTLNKSKNYVCKKKKERKI